MMHVRRALLNGRLCAADDVRVPAGDAGFQRGHGVFEVIRLYDGVPFALGKHLARLARSAARLRVVYDAEAVHAESMQLCTLCLPDSALRITVTASGLRLIVEHPPPVYPPTFSLLTLHHRVSPLLAGVKSLSYGAHMVAHQLALEAGCDTALLVDAASNRVMETPVMSFAWLSAGQLYTPPLDDGILEGITRWVLLESSDCIERSGTIEVLASCDGAAVLSTNAQMRPVHAFAGLLDRALPVNGEIEHACRELNEVIAARATVAAS